jgi:RNA polymerase sigma-70 factor (ECF subfamily)
MFRKPDDDFDALYAAHAERLYAFLAYRCGDPVLAEDLLADATERAFRARASYNPRRGTAWLYTIGLNVLRDHARRQTSEARAVERVAALAPAASSGALDGLEERDEVMGALELLAPEEREAIALHYGADLTMPEIAQATGERLTTIQGRIYRSLRKLRAMLE